MQDLTTCLWFDTNAAEAVDFYLSVFKDGKKGMTTYYSDGLPMPKGTVLTVNFSILGHEFMALNGGPNFKFNMAVSLMVFCDTQQEIDYYWSALTADGGSEVQCGWLTDKYGLSWQVVPNYFKEVMSGSDDAKKDRMMLALNEMIKLDLEALKKA